MEITPNYLVLNAFCTMVIVFVWTTLALSSASWRLSAARPWSNKALAH